MVAYRPIKGFAGYLVGDDGSVWSRRPKNGRGPLKEIWHKLVGSKDKAGRPSVLLCPGNHGKKVCRLVLEAFVGECPSGMECCHNDGNPANNNLANLRWDTPSANQLDSLKHGTKRNGERHHWAKLSSKDVLEIRDKYANSSISMGTIAKQYGIHRSNVGLIVNRKKWKAI